MSELVKAFRLAHNKVKRMRGSRWIEYYYSHEEEVCNGWVGKRRFPFKRKAQEAFSRLENLESEAWDLYDKATEAEQMEMHKIDQISLLCGVRI